MRASGVVRLGRPFLGLSAGVALAYLLSRIPPAAHLGPFPLERVVECVLLCTLGWGIGILLEDVRTERGMRQILASAGRDLATVTDETAAGRALLDSLVRLRPSGAFEVRDELGRKVSSATGKPTLFPRRASQSDEQQWPLVSGDRDLGSVRWRPPAGRRTDPLTDEIGASIIDVGALAIGAARMRADMAAMEDVVRAEQLRTVLLDAVSHHFRSPLAGILGSVTTILDLPEPLERKVTTEFLLIIKEQANRLNRYVENFLSLARLEAGSLEINLTDANLEALVYDVWDTFEELGGARRYFQLDIKPETIRTDPRLLGQALGNVLENAIKYSPEESFIEICGQVRDGRLMLTITDQGCGAPEASLTRVFDRFYRHHSVSAPGIGLGLYITRSLVEMLGGTVRAHNRTDGVTGLVIEISLPIVEAH